MMDELTVTFIVEPPSPEQSSVASDTSERHWNAFDEFAAALESHLSCQVRILEQPYYQAPTDGMVLLYTQRKIADSIARYPEALRARLAARTIQLLVGRDSVLYTLEQFRFAGAVEAYRYLRWQSQRSNESGRQVYGLRSVVQRMNGQCSPIFGSESYCLFDDLRFADLPGLLAGYMLEYWKMLEDGE